MQEDSTLRGFTIFYPDQSGDAAPTPYPWTISMIGDNAAVHILPFLHTTFTLLISCSPKKKKKVAQEYSFVDGLNRFWTWNAWTVGTRLARSTVEDITSLEYKVGGCVWVCICRVCLFFFVCCYLPAVYWKRRLGQPINIGIYVDETYDILGRIEDVHWNPWYSQNIDYMAWQLLHGRAFVFGRSDWVSLSLSLTHTHTHTQHTN